MTSRSSDLPLEESISYDSALVAARDATRRNGSEEPSIATTRPRGEYDLLMRYQIQQQNRNHQMVVKIDQETNCKHSNSPTIDRACRSTISSPDSSESLDLWYGSESIIDLFVPITICMAAVVATINSITFFTEGDVYLFSKPGCCLPLS